MNQKIELDSPHIILREMQLQGPPPEAGRPLSSKQAISLISESARKIFIGTTNPYAPELTDIATEMSKRFLLRDNFKKLVARNFDPSNSSFSELMIEKLVDFATQLTKIIEEPAAKLLAIGMTSKQIANAGIKLNFQEIQEIFSHSCFFQNEVIQPSRINAILNAKNPRELFARLEETYHRSELEQLGFSQRVVLVRNQELSELRLDVASKILQLGMPSGIAQEFALATTEAQNWFFKHLNEPGFKNCPSGLIRLAKEEPTKRDASYKEVLNLVERGANHHDAIRLVLVPEYDSKISIPLKLALDLGLTSTAAASFASSPRVQKAPNLIIGEIRTLRDLPLGFSDDKIVRIVTGTAKTYKKEHDLETKGYNERDSFVDSLQSILYDRFQIDREDPEKYQVRRLLANLNYEQIITLYKIFFNSRDFSEIRENAKHPNGLFSYINQVLLDEAEVDKLRYHQIINGCKAHLIDINSKNTSPEFQELNKSLSPFLISINPEIRSLTKQIYANWLISYAKKYYPKLFNQEPEAIESIIDATINNYDPLSVDKKSKKPADIITALSGSMKFFYPQLIKFRLKEHPAALRAYKVFSEMKNYQISHGKFTDEYALWDQLRSERPLATVAINYAQEVWQDTKNMESSFKNK